MGTRLTGIPAPLYKLTGVHRDGLDWFVLGGIYLPPGSTNGQARIFRVASNLGVTDLAPQGIGTAGKDDSLIFAILPNGTLRVTISEASVTAAGTSDSGSTAMPTVYDIPGVFPVYAPGGGTVDSVARAAIEAMKKYFRAVP